jgi:hypothetical protein
VIQKLNYNKNIRNVHRDETTGPVIQKVLSYLIIKMAIEIYVMKLGISTVQKNCFGHDS